jgi:hypothetical protein
VATRSRLDLTVAPLVLILGARIALEHSMIFNKQQLSRLPSQGDFSMIISSFIQHQSSPFYNGDDGKREARITPLSDSFFSVPQWGC